MTVINLLAPRHGNLLNDRQRKILFSKPPRRRRIWKKSKSQSSLNAKYRDVFLMRSYGVSAQQVKEMIAAQDNRCEACHRQFSGRGHVGTAAVIDHCHVTGKMRGIICCRCNRVLGLLHDDADAVRGLAAYAERHCRGTRYWAQAQCEALKEELLRESQDGNE